MSHIAQKFIIIFLLLKPLSSYSSKAISYFYSAISLANHYQSLEQLLVTNLCWQRSILLLLVAQVYSQLLTAIVLSPAIAIRCINYQSANQLQSYYFLSHRQHQEGPTLHQLSGPTYSQNTTEPPAIRTNPHATYCHTTPPQQQPNPNKHSSAPRPVNATHLHTLCNKHSIYRTQHCIFRAPTIHWKQHLTIHVVSYHSTTTFANIKPWTA